MALRGDSLTALCQAPSASGATAGLHPTARSLTPFYPSATLSLPINFSSAPGPRRSDAPSAKSSAVRLIVYPSSEEEVETHKGRVSVRSKAKTRAKEDKEKYKSTEFVESESGGSDADTSDRSQPPPRKDSPQTLKRAKPSKAVTTPKTRAKMRMNDLSWGASSSSKKRPLPPTSYPAASKRPKQGPFVVESGSENDSVSDDDDGYNFDKHITATPERSARRSVIQDRPRLDPEQEVKALPTTLKASTVRQNAARDSKSQTSASKTLASQAGKLNKNRLMTMMAKKHGGPGSQQTSLVALKTDTSSKIGKAAGRSNTVTRTPPLISGAKRELRNRPQNAARATSVSQDTSKSLPARTASTTSQATSARHKVQAKPTGSSTKPLQEQCRLTQEPGFSDRTQTRTQQTPYPPSASTTTRKADAARSHNLANSSSLRDLIGTQKTAHHKAAQEPDNIGSEWRRAQVGRAASVGLAKDTHRPGVGARYGHMLGARKSNSQDKESRSPRGAPATTGDNALEHAGWRYRATPFTVTQPPATACGSGGIQGHVEQQKTPTSGFKDPLASNSAPTLGRMSTEDLRQPDLNTELTQPSVHRIPPRLNLNGKRELVPAQQRNEGLRNSVVDETKQRPIVSSPTGPSTTRVHDRVAAQDAISPTVEKSVLEKKALSPSSKVASVHNTSPTTAQQADQSHHDPDNVPDSVSSGVHPSQQAVAESSLIPDHSKSGSDAGGDNDLDTQTPLVTAPAPAALSARSESRLVEDVDKEVAHVVETIKSPLIGHVVRAPDLYASPVASTGPRMPVAIMIRPESSNGQPLRAQGTRRASLSPDSGVSTETRQNADLSRTSKCQRLSPDRGPINTDTEQTTDALLTRNRTQALVISEAPESIDVSPDGQEPVTQNQSAAAQVDFAADDAVLEHASERSSDVEKFRTESALGMPSTLGTLPSASETTDSPRIPLLGAEPGRAPFEARVMIVPQPIPSKTLISQPLAAFSNANDAEKPSIQHPTTPLAVQNPTSSSTADITLPSPSISPTAEPYFEYTIHQSIGSSSSSTTTTELSAQPFTALDSANAQTDKLFHNTKEQYELLGVRCRSTTTRVLENGLSVHEAAFTSIENPSRSLTLKLWVERAEVSVYANHTPSLTPTTPLIGKTIYALRLWRLVERADSDSDSEAEDDNDDEAQEKGEKERFRIYHPLPHICTEVHTSLESANRAAKRVQIELSHEKTPKSMQAHLQLQNLRKLNEKLEDLRKETEEGDDESGGPSLFEYEEGRRRGCWKSTFRGVGYNGFDFELLVTSVGVSGPRNI
ncbi:hypothetical protein E8E11_001294 [Didymella keratinophila]|nr:hypothetical protein E8E11_001294 [Didymella keratinophila]